MAQITAGIKLYYGTGSGTGGSVAPTVWSELPDIISTPSLSEPPNTIDTTTLSEIEMKVYIEGLKDMGGALAFEAWYTPALAAAVTAAKAVSAENLWFSIGYPAPADARVQFKGTVADLFPGEAAVDEALGCTVYITPTTEMAIVDLTPVS